MENWDVVQNQLLQKAHIEMSNLAKKNLNTFDFLTVVNILVNHIENIPKFFDPCKTFEKKFIVGNIIQAKAIDIAFEYLKKKIEEEKRRREDLKKKAELFIKAVIEERQRKIAELREMEERMRREAERRRFERMMAIQRAKNTYEELQIRRLKREMDEDDDFDDIDDIDDFDDDDFY